MAFSNRIYAIGGATKEDGGEQYKTKVGNDMEAEFVKTGAWGMLPSYNKVYSVKNQTF